MCMKQQHQNDVSRRGAWALQSSTTTFRLRLTTKQQWGTFVSFIRSLCWPYSCSTWWRYEPVSSRSRNKVPTLDGKTPIPFYTAVLLQQMLRHESNGYHRLQQEKSCMIPRYLTLTWLITLDQLVPFHDGQGHFHVFQFQPISCHLNRPNEGCFFNDLSRQGLPHWQALLWELHIVKLDDKNQKNNCSNPQTFSHQLPNLFLLLQQLLLLLLRLFLRNNEIIFVVIIAPIMVVRSTINMLIAIGTRVFSCRWYEIQPGAS